MDTTTRTTTKQAGLFRFGGAAVLLSVALALTGCNADAPTDETPTGIAELGSDYATDTASPSPTESSPPTLVPQPGSTSSPYTPATVPPEAIDSSALPPGVSAEEAQKLVSRSQDFVLAYHGLTYEDASPSAWKARVAPIATDAYLSELDTTFPDNGSTAGWSDFQKNKTKQFASIRSAKVGIGQSFNDGTVLITVNYSVCANSNASPGTVVLSKYSRFVKLVKTGDEWKVASFKNTVGGGA